MQRPLAISVEALNCGELLTDWRWLVGSDATPLQIGIFGDWIFGMPNGSIWHLSLLDGAFCQIADTSIAFNSLKELPENRSDWFGADWADVALAHGLSPAEHECLGWKVAPIFGGPFSFENIQVFSLRVYQSIMGQTFRTVALGPITPTHN
jgi:hypothetical protein